MISDSISSAILTIGIKASIPIATEIQEVVRNLRTNLGVDVSLLDAWDGVHAPDGCFRSDGWELIPKFVGDTNCLMFLPGASEFWRFRNGNDLHAVLRECPAFEFYVCDENASYLLCSNHHDFVIGWGTALPWVRGLASN